MVNAIYGLYATPDSAQQAVDALLGIGIKDRHIAVASSEPFENYDFTRREQRTRMPWLAVAGGLAGGAVAWALTSLTQKSYPLITGGMPVSPWWTNGIIIYELTMLGAILTSLAALLISARLPVWGAQVYDRAVSDGMILVGVVNPPQTSRIKISEALSSTGAAHVRQSG